MTYTNIEITKITKTLVNTKKLNVMNSFDTFIYKIFLINNIKNYLTWYFKFTYVDKGLTENILSAMNSLINSCSNYNCL